MRVAILAFLAGSLLYLDRSGEVCGQRIPISTGLLYATCVPPTAAAKALWLPGLTALSDAVPWPRPGFSAGVAVLPAVLCPVADQPILGATVVILGGLGIVTTCRRFRSAAKPVQAVRR